MNRMPRMMVTCLLLFVLSGQTPPPAPPPAAAVDAGALLDKKVESLAIRGAEIGDALADLGKQVGVTITLDDQPAELLPWGRQTKLADLTIANASLREALPQILDALGMSYELRGPEIVVVATPALQRLDRRATWDELKLLRRARETQCTPENLAQFRLQYRITTKVDAPKMLSHQVEKAGSGSVADMLETATSALGWVWLPEGDHLVVRTGQAQVASRLARRVSARYANLPLAQILTDLGDKAGISVSFEPGMMNKLPPSVAQSYTLLVQSPTIRQALELIAADTGVRYEITPEGVAFSLAEGAAEGGKPGAARTSAFVAKISVPLSNNNVSLEWLVRADELPGDILEARSQMISEYIQKIRAEMGTGEAAPAGKP